MTAAVQRLGVFAAELRTADIPVDVLDAAALHVLDTIGCGLAADALSEVSWVKQSLDQHPSGGATVIGSAHRASAAEASLVNGTLCHGLDFDDTHPAAIVHASTVVVPAALAVGETHDRSGAEVLAAIVVGDEVAIRLGRAAGTAFHSRGLHSTGICGVFGAAAAAARLSGLDAERTQQAIGLAASMASGTLEFLADGSQTKPLHAGWAAHAGVIASRLAAGGARAPAGAIDGDRGLFATYLHGMTADVEGSLADLGRVWETPSLAFKLYPVCHYIHAALDAFVGLQRDRDLTAECVESIVVHADALTIDLVIEPIDIKRAPRTAYDAKFSLPYCIATQLVKGRVDVASFTAEEIADDEVRRVAGRVSYQERDFGSSANELVGAVSVVLTDGTRIDSEPRHARGHESCPVVESDVISKFRSNALMALDGELTETLIAGIRRMARGGDLEWVRHLAG